MSGLRKAKKYDWKDSNLALFGSDLERNVKKESAESEPAWEGCGQTVGVKVWRVVKFKITDWPEEDYGTFFNGDSYIILNTYKPDPESEELAYDVHFWIGKYSTQDEYGTAAYKTVELDTYLDDQPVQHREVMDHESALFKGYFDSVTLMEGGADSGFRRVKPEEYKPRLLRFTKEAGSKRVVVKQVPMRESQVHSGDVFILDLGLQIIQWNGASCNKDEKFQAMQYCQQLKSDRNGRPTVETIDEDEGKQNIFWQNLVDEDDDDDEPDEDFSNRPKKMFRFSETGDGQFEFTELDSFSRDNLDSNDAFILDIGNEVIVWIGGNASAGEKTRGLEYAHKYLKSTDVSLLPITVVRENQISASLDNAFK